MTAPHVLIAGAGIGGLTAAIALARRGIAVTVAERRTGFGESGAGIQISPNAGHVLDGFDLRLPVKRAALVAQALVVRRWSDGTTLAQMPLGGTGSDALFRVLRRSDLHTLLLDAARSLPGVRLVIGRSLDQVQQDEHGVTATLTSERGPSETVSAIALIGADGLWSRVREQVGDKALPRFTGFEAWRALVPNAGERLSPEVTLHLGPGRHGVHYAVAGGAQTNLVIMRAATQAREGWSRDGDAAEIASHVSGAAPALRTLAAAAPQWQVWSLFDRAPAVMAHGRIALLGDAAHPVLPFLAQGAALAIEDAAVLARLLAHHLEQGGNPAVPTALQTYGLARHDRVARVQQTSRRNGSVYHMGFPFSLARDLVMRRLGPDGLRARYGWLYDWRDAT